MTTTAAADDAPVLSDADATKPAASHRRRRILIAVGGLVAVALVAVAFNIYWQSAHYVTTENAQVAGQPVGVGSMNVGRVVSIAMSVGSDVHAGDVVARVELPSVVRTLQNGTPDLEFLGAADQVVDIISPTSGTVASVPSAAGATVAAGTPLITLIDPTLLWVSASVDENQVSRLKVGQKATVHLDALNADLDGTVVELTPATAGAFALLPQANTTTNFTKVAQVVPVRIAVHLENHPGLLGSSAEVKIRVAE